MDPRYAPDSFVRNCLLFLQGRDSASTINSAVLTWNKRKIIQINAVNHSANRNASYTVENTRALAQRCQLAGTTRVNWSVRQALCIMTPG